MNTNKDIINVLESVLERINSVHIILTDYFLQEKTVNEFAEANKKLAESYIAISCAIESLKEKEKEEVKE